MASKFGEIKLIPPTHTKDNYVTVQHAIGHLPKIDDGEMYSKDAMHYARKLAPIKTRSCVTTKEFGEIFAVKPNLERLISLN